MKTLLWAITYNSMGGHLLFSYVEGLLFPPDAPAFGAAIEEIEVYARLESREPPSPTLEDLAARFREGLETLPLVRYRRKQQRMELAYRCRAGTAEELLTRSWVTPDVPRVRAVYRELASVLVTLVGKRLKRSDDFDLASFHAFVEGRVSELDRASDDEVRALLEEQVARLRARSATSREALDQDAPPAVGRGAPRRIDIEPDDSHAEHVGHTADGRQFFLTAPFVPAPGAADGAEFIALYLFDAKGALLEARIDALGPRAQLDRAARQQLYEKRVSELGEVVRRRIRVAPFAVQRFGRQFGLITRAPDRDADVWRVEAMPGNYMAFFAPWDSGDYDT